MYGTAIGALLASGCGGAGVGSGAHGGHVTPHQSGYIACSDFFVADKLYVGGFHHRV